MTSQRLCAALGQARWRSESPDRPALTTPGKPPLTYRQLAETVDAGAGRLLEAGIVPREVVTSVLPDPADNITLFLAIAEFAACAILDPSGTAAEFEELFGRLGSRTLVVAPAGSPQAEAAARALGMQVIRAKPGRASGEWTVQRLAAAPADFGRRTGDLTYYLTSATTGHSKIVPRTAIELAAAIRMDQEALELADSDCLLSLMPLFHMHGLTTVLAQVYAGGQVVLPARLDAAQLAEWCAAYRPTWYSGGSPLHHAFLTLAPHLTRPTSLRFVRSTGPLPEANLLDRLESALGVPVVNGYGTTETSGITRNTVRHRRPGSVGRSHLLDLAIMDGSGIILPAGTPGEVVVRGPSVMAGYLDSPAANRESFRHDWFRTGDLGHLDADGFLFLHGRLSEFINRGGEKILPEEIDRVAAAHPHVREVAAFAVEHPTLGQDVALAVVAAPQVTEDELRAFLGLRLAPFKVPRQIVFLYAIPRTPTGKPKRAQLTELAKRQSLPSAEDAMPVSETEDRIAHIWREVLAVPEVDRSSDFFALGGDSLSATIMLARVENEFGVSSSPSDPVGFVARPTVAALAAMMEGRANPLSRGDSRNRILSFNPTGTRTPLILFPAAVEGLPLYLRHFADSLGPEQPLHVVCHGPFFSGAGARLRTTEELVSEAIASLLKRLPQGPYLIGGHCYGGVLAFEAAHQLHRRHEQVEALLLFDAPTPGYPKPVTAWRRYLALLRNPPPVWEALGHAKALGRIAYRRHKAHIGKVLELAGFSASRYLTSPRAVTGAIMAGYKPVPIPLPIIHFRAKDQPVSTRVLEDPRLAWQECALGGIRVIDVNGDHFSMFDRNHAPGLAAEVTPLRSGRAQASGAGR